MITMSVRRCQVAACRMAVCTLTLVLLLLTATSAVADVKLARVFADHMVLQRDQPLPVWGWAEAGEQITVSLAGVQTMATANGDGKWMAKLAPLPGGGPHQMVVAGKNTVTLSDVLIGEVWVCSGQSNMQWSLRQATKADAEIAAADHPRLRFFSVPRLPAATTQAD